MTNIQTVFQYLPTEYGKIEGANTFKYLDKIVEVRSIEREAIESRRRKITTALHNTHALYKKKTIKNKLSQTLLYSN